MRHVVETFLAFQFLTGGFCVHQGAPNASKKHLTVTTIWIHKARRLNNRKVETIETNSSRNVNLEIAKEDDMSKCI